MVWRSPLLLLALLIFLLHNFQIYPWMLDDSFITFRYSENLFDGKGPVYNPGEKVEGYTCFLWVVLMTAGKVFQISLPLFAKALSTILAVATILLTANLHRFSMEISKEASLIAAILLGTCGIFTPWASSGMEVCLFTFLFLATIAIHFLVIRDGALGFAIHEGVLLALLTMTRPEGALVVLILVIDFWMRGLRRASLYLVCAYLLLFAPYYAWRYFYYGYPLPNTFYAKVGTGAAQVYRGFRYAFHFFFAILPMVILAISSFRTVSLRALASILLFYTGYIVIVGGDIMPAFRFFAPLLPVFALFAALGLQNNGRWQGKTLWPLLIIVYNLVQFQFNPSLFPYIQSDIVALEGREVGLWIRENKSASALLATNTAGSVPYYSRLKTIDMLGMNDEWIAHRQLELGTGPAGHEKGDGAYVLSRNPDFIHFGSSLGSDRPLFLSDQEIFLSPVFRRNYRLNSYRLPSGKTLLIYEKKF